MCRQRGRDLVIYVSRVAASLALACLAEGRALAGNAADAARAAAQALEIARHQRRRGWEAWALRARGEAARCGGGADGVETSFREATVLAEERGMRPLLAHCRLGLGGVSQLRGDRAVAREHVETALDAYRAMAMPYWIARPEEALVKLD